VFDDLLYVVLSIETPKLKYNTNQTDYLGIHYELVTLCMNI